MKDYHTRQLKRKLQKEMADVHQVIKPCSVLLQRGEVENYLKRKRSPSSIFEVQKMLKIEPCIDDSFEIEIKEEEPTFEDLPEFEFKDINTSEPYDDEIDPLEFVNVDQDVKKQLNNDHQTAKLNFVGYALDPLNSLTENVKCTLNTQVIQQTIEPCFYSASNSTIQIPQFNTHNNIIINLKPNENNSTVEIPSIQCKYNPTNIIETRPIRIRRLRQYFNRKTIKIPSEAIVENFKKQTKQIENTCDKKNEIVNVIKRKPISKIKINAEKTITKIKINAEKTITKSKTCELKNDSNSIQENTQISSQNDNNIVVNKDVMVSILFTHIHSSSHNYETILNFPIDLVKNDNKICIQKHDLYKCNYCKNHFESCLANLCYHFLKKHNMKIFIKNQKNYYYYHNYEINNAHYILKIALLELKVTEILHSKTRELSDTQLVKCAYKCYLCNVKFECFLYLHYHIMKDHFYCILCGLDFDDYNTWAEHIDLHTKRQIQCYKCSLCNNFCFRNYALASAHSKAYDGHLVSSLYLRGLNWAPKHLSTHKSDTSVVFCNRTVCPYCVFKEFDSDLSLACHILQVHKSVTCNTCGYNFIMTVLEHDWMEDLFFKDCYRCSALVHRKYVTSCYSKIEASTDCKA